MNSWTCIAGLSGLTAIAMGAVGAHAVDGPYLAGLMERASIYQLIHAVALLWLSDKPALRLARLVMLAGIILFCGSLYLKALTGWEHATALAPFGGICLMAAWLLIAFKRDNASNRA